MKRGSGTLATVVVAPVIAWVVTRVIRRLPSGLRARQIGGTAEDILDLADDVDPDRDHIRGPHDAPGNARRVRRLRVLLLRPGRARDPRAARLAGDDVRYVWRHLPLNDVHPSAQLAAEASEAAAAQGKFWEMYDILLEPPGRAGAARSRALRQRARTWTSTGSRDELRRREYAPRVSEDVASADESGVSGTPTFFINGRRHYGVYDIDTLTDEVRAAKTRARQLALVTAPV